MFNKMRLKSALVEYKKRFVQTQWPDEKYKWEAVKCFQVNWDVNADDFAAMLTKALSQTGNLLASVNNFPAKMIIKFAEIAQEEVRAMFIELFDEGKDVYERIDSFKQKSNSLLERYGNGAAQHYQYENAICTYLWLRYPDKYYIYKLTEIKAVSNELESDYTFKKGAYADNIRNFFAFYNEICDELKQDEELKNMLASQIMGTCYPDPELKTLTIDVGFFISRYLRKQLLTCDYDELSENNLLNQIIKTAVMLLLRNAKVKAEYKDDLKKKMLFFSDVDKLEPTSIRWSSIRFQRNNQTYRMLISICQLIIEGMLITTDAGEYRLASFVDEQRMCRLYEKFILEYYSKHFPELSVSASQIPWSVDDGIRTMLPVMQSDIHLQKGNTVLIIDAKYYSHTTQTQYDKHTLHSNNMYQIFTYVKNRDYEFGDEDHKVSGMLLYAKTEEEIQPDNVYQMHGNQITVRTLDLNLPFSDIAKQLNTIAETHFDLPERSKG